MLAVTMTPRAAGAYCDSASYAPCRGWQRETADWGCAGPECVMCCEAHKQGRGGRGTLPTSEYISLLEREARLAREWVAPATSGSSYPLWERWKDACAATDAYRKREGVE